MIHVPASLRAELKDTLKLAGPIVLSQVGHMSMGLVDTIVAGRIGTDALAGLGLAANFFWTFTHVCIGCMLGLDTFFAQSVGARDEHALGRYFRQSFWLCGLLTVVGAVCIVGGTAAYLIAAPVSGTTAALDTYIRNVIWCLPSLFLFFLLQRYWQARHRVIAISAIIVGANVLNLAANLALGLGMWGFPRLEVQGLALASVTSRYAMLIAIAIYTWWLIKPASFKLPRVDMGVQKQFLRLGVPAAGHAGLEVGAFTLATFVVAALGAVPLAAHHVCLTLAAFTFMIPMGFSSAAAVRVGVHVGAGKLEQARFAGWLCIGLSIAVMAGFALCYLVFPRALLHWFTDDPAVVAVGMKLLMLVALFQIADGTQVCATGALRGLGNTRAAMIANLIGHYPIGLVLGLVLCFWLGYGATGMWAGLAAGLITVAIMLLRVWWKMTRDLSRIRRIV